jgi:hypothetical protein
MEIFGMNNYSKMVKKKEKKLQKSEIGPKN